MDQLWAWVFGGIAVINFLGASAVYLRGSRDKGTIETLSRSNTALQENNKILNDRVTLLETSGHAQQEKLDAQTETIEVLTNTVNSSELINVLRSDLGDHHSAAMSGMEKIHADLTNLPALLVAAIKEM